MQIFNRLSGFHFGVGEPYICKMPLQAPEIRTVNVTRYVTPLREGGSLPAIAEADDEFKYVIKFRGAGQGIKALIAELIGGELARAAKLKIPEIVFANLDAAFGRTEPDEEIQDLLKASTGINLGLHYLRSAITFDPVVNKVDGLLASKIIWLDYLLANVDRTVKNTNLLIWNKELWLIDHGAALYFHHARDNWKEQAVRPFTYIKEHVLLPQSSAIEEGNEAIRKLLTPELIHSIVSLIPDEWLQTAYPEEEPAAGRNIYTEFLIRRIEILPEFIKGVKDARQALI